MRRLTVRFPLPLSFPLSDTSGLSVCLCVCVSSSFVLRPGCRLPRACYILHTMDATRSLNPLHFPFKTNPFLSPAYASKFGVSRSLFIPQAAAKKLKVRYEIEAKANGALSADSDPLFGDRVGTMTGLVPLLFSIFFPIVQY